MSDGGFHFAQIGWLWGLLLIPLVLLWLRSTQPFRRKGLESHYADAELMPHLLGTAVSEAGPQRGRYELGWSLAWALLVLAMAGPRWDFQPVNLFSPGVDVVLLLDISRSMDVGDVFPSRLTRAQQEIEDLIRDPVPMRVGLVAFATVANVVAPITEDFDGIRHQLPAISTQMAQLQGSRLTDALLRAEQLIQGQPEDSAHNILLISDGDFADSELLLRVEALKKKGVTVHVLAVGTSGGGPVPNSRALYTATRGQGVTSRLDEEGLKRIAEAGGGLYRQADYRDDDSRDLLAAILASGKASTEESGTTVVWNERFYWFLIPALILLLMLYRPRGGQRTKGRREVRR